MSRASRMWMVVVLAAGACGGRASPPAGTRLGPVIAAALAAADDAREPWWCAAPGEPGRPAEVIAIGARTWHLEGGTLKLDKTARPSGLATGRGQAPPDPTGDVAIGVIADAAGAAPATLAALGRLRGRLQRVDLVLSMGGMGATRNELEAVFTALADRAVWPLVAIPGDLEPVEDQAAAIATVRQRGVSVIDGRRVQRIELGKLTIALVAGAGASGRLAAGADGCTYRAEDVAAAFADLTPRPGLRILASAEAPRSGAVDEPTGDPALNASAGQQIDVALYGPTVNAATPARTGGRDGLAVPLSPGSSDATTRLPGPYRFPSAGVLVVRGDTWTWTPIEGAK